ncbi:MAG: protein phosphatase 2C domain-containing protein [Bifidobacteriaceae bacterium]|jgi:protein phosphatase|nr:protein phosphatase 2C domain-containing protein [Bifidobacteriaceae bacterium]
MLQFASATATDQGKVRAVNEDAVLARHPVYAVADGMGGHTAGQIAAGIAVEEFGRLAHATTPLRPGDVAAALDRARERIAELPRGPSGRAAGTTITGAVLTQEEFGPAWLIVNLGDSRTYCYANNRLERLTEDHSEVEALLQAGFITPAQARLHPRRHVVTKALGAGLFFDPDLRILPARAGQRLLVCSDGLTEHVGDRRIAQTLHAHHAAPDAVRALLRLALAAGGKDNISVIVVDVFDDAAEADPG